MLSDKMIWVRVGLIAVTIAAVSAAVIWVCTTR
jgi:hypothetical protein